MGPASRSIWRGIKAEGAERKFPVSKKRRRISVRLSCDTLKRSSAHGGGGSSRPSPSMKETWENTTAPDAERASATSRSRRVGMQTSSPDINATNSPRAAAMPALVASEGPAFS
ncbi:hypothetical protein D3C86_1717610 [compost metagenome]